MAFLQRFWCGPKSKDSDGGAERGDSMSDNEQKDGGGYIPIVDFTKFLLGTEKQQQEVADEIRVALSTTGFFLLRNHGVPEACIEAGFAMSRDFYHRPLEEKLKHSKIEPVDTGYLSNGKETLHGKIADHKEMLDIGLVQYLDRVADGRVPPEFATQRFLELATAMRTASQNMMKAIAMSLKVKDVNILANFHESIANQHLRFPYYPPQDPNAAGVPCGPHTDYLTLTMGFQDAVGGLEVWDNSASKWHPVPAGNNDMIVNIGAPLQRWSNDELLATVHRVMPVQKERFSFFIFSGPAPDQVVDPRDLGFDTPKWEPINFLDLLLERAKDSRASVDERDDKRDKLYGKSDAAADHDRFLEEQQKKLAAASKE